jgi:hypothetical protein
MKRQPQRLRGVIGAKRRREDTRTCRSEARKYFAQTSRASIQVQLNPKPYFPTRKNVRTYAIRTWGGGQGPCAVSTGPYRWRQKERLLRHRPRGAVPSRPAAVNQVHGVVIPPGTDSNHHEQSRPGPTCQSTGAIRKESSRPSAAPSPPEPPPYLDERIAESRRQVEEGGNLRRVTSHPSPLKSCARESLSSPRHGGGAGSVSLSIAWILPVD